MSNTKLTLIKTNLRRYTFESPKIKEWVESQSTGGNILNLFAGYTHLDIEEIRNDIDPSAPAEYHKDALDFVLEWDSFEFDIVILDPPYSYRKSMEMYYKKDTNKKEYSSKFKRIADNLPRILHKDARVISFGYHSSFMGAVRGFELEELCVFAHGGAQHCTIGIVEKKSNI